MQHLSRYSARLVEERRGWTILIFDRFRFATLKQLLRIDVAIADWGRLYKLLYKVLDASICSPGDDITVKTLYITLIGAAILFSFHPYTYKKFKKISKRNLSNEGMGGWMEALADNVHKQGEHIPHNIAIL